MTSLHPEAGAVPEQELGRVRANLRRMMRMNRLGRVAWRARCAAAGVEHDSGAGTWRLAVPVWFDPAIGYWTGELDWALLSQALARALQSWEIQQVFAEEA